MEDNMLGETIKKIHSPVKKSDWILAETDRGFCELRMGGLRATTVFDSDNYEVTYEFHSNIKVEEGYTDDEHMYFRLSNGEYLTHEFSIIDANGVISAEARILSKDQFDSEFGELFFQDIDLQKL